MAIPGNANLLLLQSAAAAPTEYAISRSVRLNSADSAYLSKTFASAGNRKTWTWAGWVKLAAFGDTSPHIFGTDNDDPNRSALYFGSNNELGFYSRTGGVTNVNVITLAVFRDYSAWYHIVLTVDTTQAAAADVTTIYVNGIEQALTVSAGVQNALTQINSNVQHTIGRRLRFSDRYFDGYLADVHFIDGQALDPTSFGEFDADTGIWNPIEYTGSYGTNGFHLDFSDNSSAAALGYDAAGSNDWTVNNISAANSAVYAGSGSAAVDGSVPNGRTPYWVDIVPTNANLDYWDTAGYMTRVHDGNLSTFVYWTGDQYSGDGNVTRARFDLRDFTSVTSVRVRASSIGLTAYTAQLLDSSKTAIGGTSVSLSASSLQWFTIPVYGTPKYIEFSCTSGTLRRLELAELEVNSIVLVQDSAANDSLIDVPTNGTETDSGAGGEVRGNYCTLNPLFSDLFGSAPTISNGNLDLTQSSERTTFGTIAVSSGKWYWEITIASGDSQLFGITDISKVPVSNTTFNQVGSYYYYPRSSRKYVNGSYSSYGSTVSVGDIVGAALDLDAGTITFYKNGTSLGVMASSLPAATYVPGFGSGNATTCTHTLNFGQRSFAYDISIGISDATGAIPILSTSDDYGQTLSSGTATDSSASSLELALPGGTSAGLNLTDQSPSGRTSSTKTVVNNSVTNSTAVTKFYGGAAEFTRSSTSNLRISGTGLTYPVNSSDSCTIEFWLYMKTSSYSTRQFVVGKSNWGNNTSSYSDGIRIEKNASNNWTFQLGTATLSSSTTLNTAAQGSWAHVAAVRNGSTLSVYINGQLEGTATASSSVSAVSGDLIIGNQGTSEGSGGLYSAFLDGYITDLRYYIGTAKYTANFTPPSSAVFKALCTANLPAPTVEDGSDYMDVVTYSGTNATNTKTLSFGPDLLWFKSRSDALSHQIFDYVRGSTKVLFSDSTAGEGTETDRLTSFNTDGFTLGADSANRVNGTGKTYAAWTWDAGSSTVSNTDGSITSSVRANPTAGFSVITATTPSQTTNYSVGHGLGVTPEFYLWKFRTATSSWIVYHKSIAPYTLKLESTAAQYTGFNMPAPSSTLINLLDAPTAAWNSPFVIYAFAPVESYSAFGSYTGNGSTDGPFVFTGFRPRWVMINRYSTGGSWMILDTERNQYNLANNKLAANSTAEENNNSVVGSGDKNSLDFLSNGFKLRSTNGETNGSGAGFIYAAFAENPFALNARAR